MADLYNLLQDDNLLHGEDEEIEEEEEVENQEDWDQGEEREHVQLRPDERAAALSWTPDGDEEEGADPASKRGSARGQDGEAPLELEDLQQEGSAELGRLYSKLKSLWARELLSPELLPYEPEIVSSLVDAIADQEDAAASDAGATGNSNLDSLISSVVRVDAGRCKFLLCSLIRERLRKLEEHPWHLRLRSTDRMSENEAEYLKAYLSLLERHLRQTVLDHFPPQQVWKSLDSPEMVDEPDLDAYVFCRVGGASAVSIPNRDGIEDDDGDHGDKELDPGGEYAAGTCLIVRYSRVRRLFLEGKVDLLM